MGTGTRGGAGALPRRERRLPSAPLVDREAALALALLPRTGPVRWRDALDAAGWDAARALDAAPASAAERDAARRSAADALRHAQDRGIGLAMPGDAGYPAPLHDLHDPPPALWWLGDATALGATPRVAVVGTRNATPYGLRTARRLGEALAAAGACIVSGMAAGIDGVAHETALDAARPTVAVLGSGPDVPYPAAHRPLHRRLVAAGLVLSECPPGARPIAGAFPRRNRLVAALADLVIVVEAGWKSGAMITAGIAADLGRPVAAVPGPVDAASSAGCNGLLRDGAHVLAEPGDALTLLGLATPRDVVGSAVSAAPTTLGADAAAVWAALAVPAADVDALAARVALPPAQCAVALTALELAGLLDASPAGELRRA